MIPRSRNRPGKLSASLHMTPHLIRASYDMLRVTPPFSRWGLPEGETVVFSAKPGRDWAGMFDEQPLKISVATNQCGQLATLFPLLAHEMVHLRQHLVGDKTTHGKLFHQLAARVCRHHGWDLKAF